MLPATNAPEDLRNSRLFISAMTSTGGDGCWNSIGENEGTGEPGRKGEGDGEELNDIVVHCGTVGSRRALLLMC